MLYFHKASESGVGKTSDSAQAKPMRGTSTQPDPPTRTSNATPITTRMSSRWTWSLMGLHFLPSLLNLSPSMLQNTRILNPTTRNVVPIRSTIKYVRNIRSIQIRGNASQNPATFLSCRQRKMSPLPVPKHLQNLSTRLLQRLNLRPAGRWI